MHGGVPIAFLLVVLALYGLVQLLILWLLRRALRPGSRWRLAPVAFLILVNSTLVLSRLVTGWPGAARVVAFVGHWWVAASMWFVSIAAAVGLWNCAALVVSRAGYKGRRLLISPRGLFGMSGVLVLGLTVWGVHEAGAIRLETIVIETPRLPAGSAPVRVVQLSDLHLSLLMGRRRFARILDRVRQARPDLLVFTGDFADGASPYERGLSARLAELDAPLGKLAVTGNHEFYHGLDRSLELLRAAGFRVLRGEGVRVTEHLTVVGVDDPAARGLVPAAFTDEGRVLPPRQRPEFVILLKHQPVVDGGSLGRFDLQLSGHTHGGQVFPARWSVRLFYRHIMGRYELPGGASLYVSRGAGTFGPPMRVLSPPEVTLFILRPAP